MYQLGLSILNHQVANLNEQKWIFGHKRAQSNKFFVVFVLYLSTIIMHSMQLWQTRKNKEGTKGAFLSVFQNA